MKNFDFSLDETGGALVGDVLIPRDFADMDVWKRKKFDPAHALIDLYFLANNSAGQFTLQRGVTVAYEAGEVLWSNKGLADRWGWTREQVEKFMVDLERSALISRRPAGQYGKVIKLTEFVTQTSPKTQRTDSETAAIRQPSDTVGGTESIGTERGEPTAKPPRVVTLEQAIEWMVQNGAGYSEAAIREQWLYYDAMRDPETGVWRRPAGRTGLMLPVTDWRSELSRALNRFNTDSTPIPTGNQSLGEAPWKKLRAIDDEIAELETQITGFENTQPDLAERLEEKVKKLRAERKELAA